MATSLPAVPSHPLLDLFKRVSRSHDRFRQIQRAIDVLKAAQRCSHCDMPFEEFDTDVPEHLDPNSLLKGMAEAYRFPEGYANIRLPFATTCGHLMCFGCVLNGYCNSCEKAVKLVGNPQRSRMSGKHLTENHIEHIDVFAHSMAIYNMVTSVRDVVNKIVRQLPLSRLVSMEKTVEPLVLSYRADPTATLNHYTKLLDARVSFIQRAQAYAYATHVTYTTPMYPVAVPTVVTHEYPVSTPMPTPTPPIATKRVRETPKPRPPKKLKHHPKPAEIPDFDQIFKAPWVSKKNNAL